MTSEEVQQTAVALLTAAHYDVEHDGTHEETAILAELDRESLMDLVIELAAELYSTWRLDAEERWPDDDPDIWVDVKLESWGRTAAGEARDG